jgi:hypothetical protein
LVCIVGTSLWVLSPITVSSIEKIQYRFPEASVSKKHSRQLSIERGSCWQMTYRQNYLQLPPVLFSVGALCYRNITQHRNDLYREIISRVCRWKHSRNCRLHKHFPELLVDLMKYNTAGFEVLTTVTMKSSAF